MARWSLGVFGDLLWDSVPELRPGIRDLIDDRVRAAVDLDGPIETPGVNDLVNHVIGPLLDAMERGTAPAGQVAGLARFIHRALTHEGPDAALLRHDLDLYLLENVDTDLLLPKLLAADPALGPALRRAWPEATFG